MPWTLSTSLSWVHLSCGWRLAVPLANSDINLNAQLIGISVIFGFVFLASVLTWDVIRTLAGLRVSEDDEYRGVDVSECGLEAYPEFTGNR